MKYEGIPRVNRYRYLRLVFDEKLTIFAYIEFMEKKTIYYFFTYKSHEKYFYRISENYVGYIYITAS